MIDLLEQVSEKEAKPTASISFSRKRFDDDDLSDLGIWALKKSIYVCDALSFLTILFT